MLAAVADVERELAGLDTDAWRWTLTWLEGRPVVELDDGTVIRLDPHSGNDDGNDDDDAVVVTAPPS